MRTKTITPQKDHEEVQGIKLKENNEDLEINNVNINNQVIQYYWQDGYITVKDSDGYHYFPSLSLLKFYYEQK